MTPEQLKEVQRICPRWRDRPLSEVVAAVERVQAKALPAPLNGRMALGPNVAGELGPL